MPKLTNQGNSSIVEVAKSIAIDLDGSRQKLKFQRLYKNDRIAFLYDVMPSYARTIAPYQLEMLGYFDEGKTRVSVRGPHGLGKTFIAAIMVHHAILTTEEDCKVPTTASANRQLEKYLWPEIRKAAKNIAWPVVGRPPYEPQRELLRNSIRLRGGIVEAFAVASDRHDYVEGAHATIMRYILDEAKTIPSDMWDAIEGAFSSEGLIAPDDRIVVPTMLGDEGNSKDQYGDSNAVKIEGESKYSVNVFAISTPGPPVGRFYDIHMKKPGYEDWYVKHVSLDEAIRAGRVSAKWAEQRKRQWGENSSVYQNRVLGQFSDNTEDGVIPLSWVDAAMERYRRLKADGTIEHMVGTAQRRDKCVGVDVARYGGDETVLAKRIASLMITLQCFQRQPTTATAGNVFKFAQGGFHVNIETDGGLGASVYDMLFDDYTEKYSLGAAAELLHPITVGGKTGMRDQSGELGFYDVRSAMWWHMRELLDPNNGRKIALVPDERLRLDLVTPTWEVKRMGIVKVQSKEEIKRLIGRSTDRGDACCLAFWEGGGQGGGVVF